MLTILVIDDSFTARSIMTRLLNDKYRLILADSGKNGLQELTSNHVDLVLLDLLMPAMDGFQTLSAIREIVPEIPVLVLSADIQESTRRRILDAGASGMIHKPPKQDELIRLIEEISVKHGITGEKSTGTGGER
jgi:twitching motility two-component system response regulator PilH